MANDLISTSAGHDRNTALQVLRGLAALAVVLFHAAFYTVQKGAPPWLGDVFSAKLAAMGVLVFFVLSGFLMEGAILRYSPTRFLLHRLARLYPTYWSIFLAFFLIQAARVGTFDPIPWKALTLLPVGETPRPLAVEWTLVFEVFFYGVCTVLCRWPRAHLPTMAIWLAVIIATALRHDPVAGITAPIGQIVFCTANVGFICGGIAGQANRRFAVDPTLLWLGAITLLLLGALDESIAGVLLTSSGVAVAIMALSRPVAARGGTAYRALYRLGDYSYGLFLAHCLAIQIALQYVDKARFSDPLPIFAGMLGVGLAAGLVAGAVDVRIYRSLKQRIDARFGRGAVLAPPAKIAAE